MARTKGSKNKTTLVKRGRPVGSGKKKDGRGRPKGSTNKNQSVLSENTMVASQMQAKKRGRPSKSAGMVFENALTKSLDFTQEGPFTVQVNIVPKKHEPEAAQ